MLARKWMVRFQLVLVATSEAVKLHCLPAKAPIEC
jgi:ornithine carbamoyltransferase